MRLIKENGEPQDLIITQIDLDRIIYGFKEGKDLREVIKSEMFINGIDGVDINKVWIYFEE